MAEPGPHWLISQPRGGNAPTRADGWLLQDEKLLFQLVFVVGTQWFDIARVLGNKSEEGRGARARREAPPCAWRARGSARVCVRARARARRCS